MVDFIKIQYALYLAGGQSIGIESIKALANVYLTAAEQIELFGEEETYTFGE